MKLIVKILAAPLVAVLTLIVWIMSFLINLTAGVFGLVSSILGIFGLLILLLDNKTNGAIVLAVAFLVSPYGLPLLAVIGIGQIQRLRYAIQSRVYC